LVTPLIAGLITASGLWLALPGVQAAEDGLTAKNSGTIPGGPAAAKEYAACMDLARRDPKAAHEKALAWRAGGGGDAASHCLAVALIGRGEYVQAAEKMEALAAGMADTAAALKGGLFGQAGNAWTIAGRPGKAYEAQTRALALTPRDPNILIDRGITLTSTGKFWKALDDLNKVLEIAPGRVDALVFRAMAWRQLDSLDLAADDLRRALELRPDNPDALLERGIIRRRQGDRRGARSDWMRVLELAPDGPLSNPLADAARGQLEKLDVKKP
jgi:tetratricopeptide (TPR) repeat protein